jgi:medium-chain acyl-[acyl-carrier-protein] hydrolase
MLVSAHRAPQLPAREAPIHSLPDSELLVKLRRLNSPAGEALKDPELRELLLPLLRADLAVCETYVHSAEEPLDCPIYAFGGLDDDEVNPEELAAWRIQTRGPFKLSMLPGDHFFLHSARARLLQAMRCRLFEHLRQLEQQ